MEQIIRDFQHRRLQIDFVEFILVQNKATDPISFHGAGYIRQTDNDDLTFTLYAIETANTNFVTDSNNLERVKAGKLYNAADFYTLTGTAIDGTGWVAEDILPNCSWLGRHSNPVVRGSIARCARGKRAANARGLRMQYFDKADIPCLINDAKFTAAECEFHVQKADDSFTVTAKSEKLLPDHFEVRIEEALRFLLAQSVSCRVLEVGGQLQLISKKQRPQRTLLPPPISRGGSAFREYSWLLFARYLGYVSREAQQEYWHPCSNHLNNACEASANALDAWAIGLSVAVEGLANLIPKELDPKTREKLEALKAFIVAQVTKSSDHEAFAPRIQGLVNGLTQLRAIDRMKQLVAIGCTKPEFVDAWQKLRNRGVHPTKRAGGDLSPDDYQRLIDEVHQVVELMYHIVFSLIDYKGPYTEYSVHGFPQGDYLPGGKVSSPEELPARKPALATKIPKSQARETGLKDPALRKPARKARAKSGVKPRGNRPKITRRSR